MPRKALPSNSLSAAVRNHFGLTQDELGRFLGVSGAVVAHAEAGRRTLPAPAQRRLRPLALLLPAPDGLGPAYPAPPPATEAPADLGPLDPDPVRERLRRVRYLAGKTRFELENRRLLHQARTRRRWGLAVLAALLAPAPEAAPTPAALAADPTLDPTADRPWVERLLADTEAVPPPLSATQAALLALRLRLLEAEADALTELLAGAG
ncbi:hypothetical protein [Hymenobacter cellulosivorans]|uniref:XRE family transcriptional regulator n=1 Tax=Hymenobacter cellulosivorans TaxID=2932249 RepID=A0ABY4F659_9BACT|nr:hypothetical protein [Hymenobacter cellulosivorans]UOQ51597.1 hypothetical protein MUN80_17760 [Hymenobacter cellulosivorans]